MNKQQQKALRKAKIYGMYNRIYRPASDFGFTDEKRLQETFHDKTLRLRFNILDKICSVWQETSNGPVCLYTIHQPYNICRAIFTLKNMQKSLKQIAEENEAIEKEDKYQSDKSTNDLAEVMTDAVRMHHVGKVSVTV